MATLDLEDLLSPEHLDGFKKKSAEECITAMSKHRRHNGVLFEALKRLSALSKLGYNTVPIIQGLEEIIQAVQTYSYDTRLLVYAFCTIGNGLLHLGEKPRLHMLIDHTVGLVAQSSLRVVAVSSNLGAVAYASYTVACLAGVNGL
eukprot:TRINITY_DN4103_c0_g1_i1.p1 TRINITY_DN4103_c0_g1~~TRINITY_DN4103_c0_g1_i1.p1  ORF type:complete len:146 (-),score=27.05 TRINITY_DN4103_c0_g1_i1:365-802(-)